jgi:hypothetical protein
LLGQFDIYEVLMVLVYLNGLEPVSLEKLDVWLDRFMSSEVREQFGTPKVGRVIGPPFLIHACQTARERLIEAYILGLGDGISRGVGGSSMRRKRRRCDEQYESCQR